MGCIEDAGYLTLSGRKKEMIVRGKANIYPAEIENVLRMQDMVIDAVVVGTRDKRLGERVRPLVGLGSRHRRIGMSAMPFCATGTCPSGPSKGFRRRQAY